mmetsp:Transcript_26926/g.36002  ORF Transcript_26926/g.36002 Transcript_26926/m.36002 type:complete len:172 (-) Transcript_26926:399-914(-)
MHKCSLETNKLASVDFLNLMYLNRSLLELELIDQRFGKEKQPTLRAKESAAAATAADYSSESDDGPTKTQSVPISELRENKTLRKLKISRGYLASIKPLVRCLITFSHLVKLELSYVKLNKLHIMAVDNYLIQNPRLRTLKLVGVKLNNDLLKLIAGTVEVSQNLHSLDLA